MILKLLLVIAVIFVVYIMFFKAKKPRNAQTTEEKNHQANIEANELVPCVHCGTYLEVEEAILSNGKYYCSSECVTEAA